MYVPQFCIISDGMFACKKRQYSIKYNVKTKNCQQPTILYFEGNYIKTLEDTSDFPRHGIKKTLTF